MYLGSSRVADSWWWSPSKTSAWYQCPESPQTASQFPCLGCGSLGLSGWGWTCGYSPPNSQHLKSFTETHRLHDFSLVTTDQFSEITFNWHLFNCPLLFNDLFEHMKWCAPFEWMSWIRWCSGHSYFWSNANFTFAFLVSFDWVLDIVFGIL